MLATELSSEQVGADIPIIGQVLPEEIVTKHESTSVSQEFLNEPLLPEQSPDQPALPLCTSPVNRLSPSTWINCQ